LPPAETAAALVAVLPAKVAPLQPNMEQSMSSQLAMKGGNASVVRLCIGISLL
jgi:hypothetical protein